MYNTLRVRTVIRDASNSARTRAEFYVHVRQAKRTHQYRTYQSLRERFKGRSGLLVRARRRLIGIVVIQQLISICLILWVMQTRRRHGREHARGRALRRIRSRFGSLVTCAMPCASPVGDKKLLAVHRHGENGGRCKTVKRAKQGARHSTYIGRPLNVNTVGQSCWGDPSGPEQEL